MLIEVPTLTATGRVWRKSPLRSHVRPSVRRRRLRREIRIAGRALLAAVPLALLVIVFSAGQRPTASEASPLAIDFRPDDRLDGSAGARPPMVSLSVEPASMSPHAEIDPPVVLPGYLLPDDGGEEPSHAGS